jgi:hypothetical protein
MGTGHLSRDCRDTAETLARRKSAKVTEMGRETMKKAPVQLFLPPRYTLGVSQKHGHDSMNTQVGIGDKSCLIHTDTEASVTIAIPDITTGLPERDLTTSYVLQMASGETLPISKEALITLTLGRRPLTTWVFVAKITDKFILDRMHTHDASMDLRHHVL